ncbi:MAG: rhomboid family intramembrane serine protease [Spirochaetes bacterium]|nr:rhomboid family intramembrane serine protease [Spirochaetota bacterium]
MEKYLFSVTGILGDKNLYRLMTSQFFHADWTHLLFNMISLYSFGILLEQRLGPGLVAIIYFSAAIAGDLTALAIKRNEPGYRAVGASGAVCGIIFASIFLLPGGSIYVFPLPIALPSWVYAILFMAISLYGIGRKGSIIGHEAHIGGALAGMAGAVIYRPSIFQEEYTLLAALTVPVIILLIYFIRKA